MNTNNTEAADAAKDDDMSNETKTPTIEQIDLAWKMVFNTFREQNNTLAMEPGTTPAQLANMAHAWDDVLRVIDYAAACLRAEEEGERVPQVEAPEDAGDDGPDDDGWIAWEGGECPVGCTTEVQIDQRNGIQQTDEAEYFRWAVEGIESDIVRYRIVAEDKPEPTPEQRVAGMSDEEVEALVTEAGVGEWHVAIFTDGALRMWPHTAAIGTNGTCWRRVPPLGTTSRFDDVTGDTTTKSGRMECTRRLAVHLLKDEAGKA